MASASATNRATSYSNRIPFPPITSRALRTTSRVRRVQNTFAREACSSVKRSLSCSSDNRKHKVCIAVKLERSNGFSELFPFFGIFQGTFISAPCAAHCLPSHGGPGHFQHFCGIFEGITFLKTIVFGHSTIDHGDQCVLDSP